MRRAQYRSGLLLVLLTAACGAKSAYGRWPRRSSPSGGSGSGYSSADHYSSAQGVIDDYEKNLVRADRMYPGKRWIIEKFRVDTINGRFVGMGAEPSELRLIFDDDDTVRFSVGDELRASCDGKGHRAGHIVFDDCGLLDVGRRAPAARHRHRVAEPGGGGNNDARSSRDDELSSSSPSPGRLVCCDGQASGECACGAKTFEGCCAGHGGVCGCE